MPLIFLCMLALLLNACAAEQASPNQNNVYQSTPLTTTKAPSLKGQCVGLSQSNINAIKKLQLPNRRYMYYCIPCGDKKAKNPLIIPTVAFVRYDENTWTFNFGDGYSVDAADIYIESKANSNQFLNLSKLIGCPAKWVNNDLVITGKKK